MGTGSEFDGEGAAVQAELVDYDVETGFRVRRLHFRLDYDVDCGLWRFRPSIVHVWWGDCWTLMWRQDFGLSRLHTWQMVMSVGGGGGIELSKRKKETLQLALSRG